MVFNCDKFEWIRYSLPSVTAPTFQYLSPDLSNIHMSDSLRDLGVILSKDVSFDKQIDKAIASASNLIGWALRSFRGRGCYLMVSVFKSLVQPHLDYCCQLWSPSAQYQINKLEKVQKNLVTRIRDPTLSGLNYWQKLQTLGLTSQERRRERFIIIFIWKIS